MQFYRYESNIHLSKDGTIRRVSVDLITYNLFKETPKGHWIGYGSLGTSDLRGSAFWVSKTSKRRRAYPTKKEAMTNFIKRTEQRVKILSNQIDYCKTALIIARKEDEKI